MGNSTSSGRSWPRDVRDLFRSTSRSSRHQVDHNDRSTGHGHATTHLNDHCTVAADTSHAGSTQRPAGSTRTNYNKLNSCPDLQVVARSGHSDPQRRQRNDVDQPPMKVNVKIYRSYRFHGTVILLDHNFQTVCYGAKPFHVLYFFLYFTMNNC